MNGHNPNPSSPRRKPNANAASSDRRAHYQRRSRSGISWADIAPSDIGTMVTAITSTGCAVILGRTSDGGALSINILDADERVREWPSSADDFEAFLQWVTATYVSQ